MSRRGESVLIAAQSGRALAQAARRAGLRPFVLDLFGDADTLAAAEAHRTMPGRFGAGRRGSEVLAALEALQYEAGEESIGVILGSGFEGSTPLIAEIASRYRLIGSGAETVAALKDPFAFAALCERLSIPHPAVSKGPVTNPLGWLCKQAGGSGGAHIRKLVSGTAPPGHYLQARVPGRAFALNVLADGRDLAVLALTEQWASPSPLRPYRYAGALAPGREEEPSLSPATLAQVTEAVARLVAATGLRGIASADLLIDGETWWLLEINPRPGATLDILDRRGEPLLAAHVEASLGRLPALGPSPMDAAGTEICYAPRSLPAVPTLDWPDFAHDRPRAGTRVGREAPFCTVSATGPDAATVRTRLRERATAIRALLAQEDRNGFGHHGPEHQRPDRAARRAPRP